MAKIPNLLVLVTLILVMITWEMNVDNLYSKGFAIFLFIASMYLRTYSAENEKKERQGYS